MTNTFQPRGRLARAAIGLLVATAVMVLLPRETAPAYLAAWFLFAAVPLGSAAILMVFHCTGGAWGRAIRPQLEAAVAAVPLVCMLALPLAVLASRLYPWAVDPTESSSYYRPLFVAARTVIILILWSLLAIRLAVASRASPRAGRSPSRLRAGCAVGLIVYVLTVTFAFTDLVQSVEQDWHSSIFGFIVICAQGLGALAFAIGVVSFRAAREGRRRMNRLSDLGNLLLAFVLLHAYAMFSQFFIIWNGNVPERSAWYRPRADPPWSIVLAGAAAMQFAIPFVAMLFRSLKQSTRAMVCVAAIVLAGSWLEAAWIAIPSANARPLTLAHYVLLTVCLVLVCVPWPPRVDRSAVLTAGAAT